MVADDLKTISAFLGFAPQHIFYLVELADKMYFEFEVKKANGGKRKISAPRPELKGVQRAILEKILERVPVDEACFAYVKGKGVVDAASQLSGYKAVLRLDIQNFFPSISQFRVHRLFGSIGYNSKVSYILSRLCTLNGALCQGAPTSPYLSNLVFRKTDRQLRSLATSFKLSYIRYSDDIFLFANSNFNHIRVSQIAYNILTENGFQAHPDKTHYHRKSSPRFTLGLQTMGKTPQLTRAVKRNLRAAFFKASKDLKWGAKNLNYLSGMAEWHKCVYGPDDRYRDYIRTIRNVRNIKFHEVYSQ